MLVLERERVHRWRNRQTGRQAEGLEIGTGSGRRGTHGERGRHTIHTHKLYMRMLFRRIDQ